MKWKIFVAGLALHIITGYAADANSLASSEAEAWTETDTVAGNLKKNYPATSFSDIKKTPIEGIYQVGLGRNIVYVEKSGRYFLFGRMFDMLEQKDLTGDVSSDESKLKFADLPLKDAIKVKKGNGKRVFAVFTDPDCPFCKQLESTVSRMDDYTMYLFLYPIASLHPNAPEVAESIWCHSNQAKAFQEYVLDGVKPARKTCNNPIQRNIALADKYGMSGTPTLIHSNGAVAPGAMPRQDLESWLGSNK